MMQQNADFITADFLYMFRASSTHHQEYKTLTQQPPVQVKVVLPVPVAAVSVFYTPDDGCMTPETCRESLQ